MNKTLQKLMQKETLTEYEAQSFVEEMMNGMHNHETMAAVLSVIQFRGVTAEELAGFAKGMQAKASNVTLDGKLLDTCGTGGDDQSTYNVSTAAAILVSSLGVHVAKHGNRSISSKTGSADVLEMLGIPFQRNQQEAKTALEAHQLSFFFAPDYHQAMKYVGPVRSALKMKTVFNLLGPLTNPAGAQHRIIGVYGTEEARVMAEAASRMELEKVLFVSGHDGLDELTITGASTILEVQNGKVTEYAFDPEDAGLKRGTLTSSVVETSEESAALIMRIFKNEAHEDATNLLLLNAGAALYAAGEVSSIKEGVTKARGALGDQVLGHLERLKLRETSEKAAE
ncbi:anthranilate phosphoribosyltransferase [Salisediminibacterium selenitireducens]|uniref:Anthranilate phosphoribosyltransferase n=1 Tax=Bacillus selenitireducens (strain ATCC 700615 / DSM 15326 / MLS10) TaxID=439292 RepID=D6XUZ3_BACIE|nr:anthranilate phosphoribosyltransferase [Salisediminibacterium selenitireducens]ADH99629.1 anthranilate phosphoribosyltransferase [[Bacillus] selenitireducens MLS10]